MYDNRIYRYIIILVFSSGLFRALLFWFIRLVLVNKYMFLGGIQTMSKRILSLFLVLVMLCSVAFTFSACSDGNEKNENENKEEAFVRTPTLLNS